jgi:signal transduction histidine kinase
VNRLGDNPVVRAVGRIPASVQRKLLAAFAIVVMLLVAVGVLGIDALNESNNRVNALGLLPERAATYQQLATFGSELNSLLVERNVNLQCVPLTTPALYCPPGRNPTYRVSLGETDGAIALVLDELSPLTVLSNLDFVPPPNEQRILDSIRSQYVAINKQVQTLLSNDDEGVFIPIAAVVPGSSAVSSGYQQTIAVNITNGAETLVGIIKTATSTLEIQNNDSYLASQHLFVGVAAASVVLALLLGIVLSWALVEPIRKMRARLRAIESGDFSTHVNVGNRDELGDLAADLNRMNDELGRLYNELENASRHKSEFLANMSHELRTPLNAVIGFSEVLDGRLFGELNEKQAEYVSDIHTSGQHLLTLINDILDLSKIEAGRMDLQVTSFALSDVLQNSIALTRERATRGGISLQLDADSSVGVVEADERMIKQVLFNLLTNAVKFTPRGGHVEVSARGDDGNVVVSVRDDGVGIAPVDHGRIFEEFQQVGTAHLQEGTGLGLAISRRFVQLHGGSIRVESQVGGGSTFTVTVPRRPRAATTPDADAALHAEERAVVTHATASHA